MKKLCFIFLLLATVVTGNLFAQTTVGTSDPAATSINIENVMVSSVTLKEGTNTVPVPNGRGSITVVKRGDSFSGAVYTDAAGKVTRLTPNSGATGNLPKPACKYPIPDACFGIPNSQKVGMCICRPTNIAGSSEPYTISLILPAVQKIREAANR